MFKKVGGFENMSSEGPYRCKIDGCDELLDHIKGLKLHLIHKHGYSKIKVAELLHRWGYQKIQDSNINLDLKKSKLKKTVRNMKDLMGML